MACAKRETPPPPREREAPITDAAERLSLFDIAHGGTVVSRTGEALLETSALRAIDGDPGAFWMTALHDLPESMIVALPARSRIDKFGIRTIVKGGFTANHVSFEASADGRAFTPIATIKSASTTDAQWFDVAPAEASYVRVTIVDSSVPDHEVRLYSAMARGTEIEPPHSGDLTGCWSINGEQAQFQRRGSHVTGVLYTGKEPMRFDGGYDGRIYRLSWIRGNDHGMALITVSADGHLSGLNWHEEAIPMFFDTSWFGERGKCSKSIPADDAPHALLGRTGRYSLYGAERDIDLPRLLQGLGQYRFVAHEFRFPTAKENHDAAERELAALREQLEAAGVKLDGVAFVAQGSADPRQDPITESMRALYSTVDLEIRR
jgi:hypothetical protein